ncbi:DUF4148 domain-containing protein [Ramlibacter sp.]|uniref:DUF4148 domain-containing protein n=1 Tax=Ramlibacter sp. TaxID=1917967 RepID=UPI002D2F90B6|nr:DUF4148 domain-containing protein [Ramlibacter sp.]HYD77514.1 DUF4148 domain-containing protein [Ramlibacter sp.]
MKRTLAIALVTAAAAGTAFAENYAEYNNIPFDSSRTRAEVQAELAQFKASGVNPWSRGYSQTANFESQKTRAEVVGDYIVARDRVAAMTGEDSGSAYLARNGQQQPSGDRFAHNVR